MLMHGKVMYSFKKWQPECSPCVIHGVCDSFARPFFNLHKNMGTQKQLNLFWKTLGCLLEQVRPLQHFIWNIARPKIFSLITDCSAGDRIFSAHDLLEHMQIMNQLL